MSAGLAFAPVTALARMIASKAVSPVEVVRAQLERITALDGTLRAYLTVCDEAALAAARAARFRRQQRRCVDLLAHRPHGLRHRGSYILRRALRP